jgi:UDP-N-acetyl-D-mannosaminuronate dehydrogenase
MSVPRIVVVGLGYVGRPHEVELPSVRAGAGRWALHRRRSLFLSHLAQQLGHDPQVILAGRGTNDGMGRWIADTLHERCGGRAGRALVLGLTFKENVPDLRNSRSFDLVERLVELGYDVAVADPIADPEDLRA